jgi:hypothetical protein
MCRNLTVLEGWAGNLGVGSSFYWAGMNFFLFFRSQESLVSDFVLWDVQEFEGVAPGADGNCFEKVETRFSGLAYVGLVWRIGVGIRAHLWVFLHVLHW